MNRLRRPSALWFPVALLLMVQMLLVAYEDSPVRRRALSGTDGYMRLVRVEALYETGDWYDAVVRRSNAPYGEALHWTRPLDVLLLAGAVPLAPILGFTTALYWSGALISPVLHVLTLLALMWAARPLFDRQGLVYLGVLAIVQPAVLSYFAAGRPDHHGLIGLLFVLVLGLVLRLLARPFDARPAIVAGAVAAALLWVSVEGLLTVALALAATGLGWIGAKDGFARSSLMFSLMLVAGLILALLVERPWGDLGAEEYDRLSLVHVFVFAAIGVFWVAAWALERRTALCDRATGRAVVALAGAVAVGGAVGLVFPKFFGGPFVDVDPQVIALWFNNLPELRPLIVPDNPVRSLLWVVFFLGPALLAVPYLLYLLSRHAEQRRTWMGVALGLALFLPLALYQMRWAAYVEFLVVLPYTALLVRVLHTLDTLPVGGGAAPIAVRSPPAQVARAAMRALVVVAFATGFLLLTVVIYRLGPDAGRREVSCPLTAMTMYLGEAFRGPPRRILSFFNFGPEILYRTPHEVVATPYHRNAAGILDTYEFFMTTEDRAAREIVDRRGIDLVLICPLSGEAVRYRTEDGAATLYRRLEEGELPGWLRPLALPADLQDSFRLFEVTGWRR